MDGGFSITLIKDIFKEEQLHKIGLSERKVIAILSIKEYGKITNKEYISLLKVSRITATKTLQELVVKKILKSSNIKGSSAFESVK